jgi:TPR repeat protein
MKRERIGVLVGLAALPLLCAMALATDDTARFTGTWETTFPYNGRTVRMISVHDGSHYQNYIILPTGKVAADGGTFSAVDGKWTTTAQQPNNSGTYRFLNDNTVLFTNAVGQTSTWRRQTSAQPKPVASAPPESRPTPDKPQPASSPPEEPASTSNNAHTKRAIAAFDQKDYKTAWSEFMQGAKEDDAEAEAGVGAMLYSKMNPPGTGFYAQCEKWLLSAANKGNTKGMTFLGKFYYDDGRRIAGGINPGINNSPISPAEHEQAEKRFALARQWFERASDLGDGYAMGNLAIMLDAGVGGPRDPERAAQLRKGVATHADTNFARRATQDPANLAMTASWQAGHYAEALENARARAEKGDASAQAMLGRAYYEGLGVKRDYATALEWLNKAVARNNADAMFFLGLLYEHGYGVAQNIPKAVELFDRAASLHQRYAEMEVKGMRMQGESDRIAALIHQGSGVEERACFTAGGTSVGPECIRGGETIDPYKP